MVAIPFNLSESADARSMRRLRRKLMTTQSLLRLRDKCVPSYGSCT